MSKVNLITDTQRLTELTEWCRNKPDEAAQRIMVAEGLCEPVGSYPRTKEPEQEESKPHTIRSRVDGGSMTVEDIPRPNPPEADVNIVGIKTADRVIAIDGVSVSRTDKPAEMHLEVRSGTALSQIEDVWRSQEYILVNGLICSLEKRRRGNEIMWVAHDLLFL